MLQQFTRRIPIVNMLSRPRPPEQPRTPFGQWAARAVYQLSSILETQGYHGASITPVVKGFRNLVIPVRPSHYDLAKRKNLKKEWVKLAENFGIAAKTKAYAEWDSALIYYFLKIPDDFQAGQMLLLNDLPAGVIGQTEYRKPVPFQFTEAYPHCLVTGSTGSGKSVTLEAIIINLCRQYTPEQLWLIIVDPHNALGVRGSGRVGSFEGLAHLKMEIARSPEQIYQAHQMFYNILRHRMRNDLFGDAQPKVVMIADELSNEAVLGRSSKPNQHNFDIVSAIGAETRKYNMHFIGGIQNPEEVAGRIWLNLNYRFVGMEPDNSTGARVLGKAGYQVNALLGQGDFLVSQREVHRFQVALPAKGDFDKLPRGEIIPVQLSQQVEPGQLDDDLARTSLDLDGPDQPERGAKYREVDNKKLAFYVYYRLKISEADARVLEPLLLKRAMHERHRDSAREFFDEYLRLQREGIPLEQVRRIV